MKRQGDRSISCMKNKSRQQIVSSLKFYHQIVHHTLIKNGLKLFEGGVLTLTNTTLIWMSGCRYTGPGCMSTNTIIVTCNAVLGLLLTFLTLLPCTKKTTGGLVPAALQAAIGGYTSYCILILYLYHIWQKVLQVLHTKVCYLFQINLKSFLLIELPLNRPDM